jgi:hypothetical protein
MLSKLCPPITRITWIARVGRTQRSLQAAALALAGLVVPAGAHGQGLEALGNRASALAAFVAVADDASAVAWNPAGLASGPFFNVSLDLGRFTRRPDDPPVPGASGSGLNTTLVAIGTTPVGLAYYRMASTAVDVSTPAVVGSPDRQNDQVVVRTLATNHLGATVQQSVGDHLMLGATVKVVRAQLGAASGTASSWEQAFDAADRIDGQGFTRGDVDIGAMAWAGRMRVGLVVRNATSPTFGEEGGLAVNVPRHARVGVAWGDGWTGMARTIVALDADVTRVPQPDGERRDVAVGAERWWGARRFGVRGGVRASTIGDERPVVSAGASFAVRAGSYVDVYLARGSHHERAWGLAARFTY